MTRRKTFDKNLLKSYLEADTVAALAISLFLLECLFYDWDDDIGWHVECFLIETFQWSIRSLFSHSLQAHYCCLIKSGIQTQIVEVEGEHADHLTTIVTQNFPCVRYTSFYIPIHVRYTIFIYLSLLGIPLLYTYLCEIYHFYIPFSYTNPCERYHFLYQSMWDIPFLYINLCLSLLLFSPYFCFVTLALSLNYIHFNFYFCPHYFPCSLSSTRLRFYPLLAIAAKISASKPFIASHCTNLAVENPNSLLYFHSRPMGSGFGAVGRVVASDTRDPRFESSQRLNF